MNGICLIIFQQVMKINELLDDTWKVVANAGSMLGVKGKVRRWSITM